MAHYRICIILTNFISVFLLLNTAVFAQISESNNPKYVQDMWPQYLYEHVEFQKKPLLDVPLDRKGFDFDIVYENFKGETQIIDLKDFLNQDLSRIDKNLSYTVYVKRSLYNPITGKLVATGEGRVILLPQFWEVDNPVQVLLSRLYAAEYNATLSLISKIDKDSILIDMFNELYGPRPMTNGDIPPTYPLPVRAFLKSDAQEEIGLGLYSYILIRNPPTENTEKRIIATIDAYLNYVSPIAVAWSHTRPENLNVVHLPLIKSTTIVTEDTNISIMDILNDYDYFVARLWLQNLELNSEGPYIVTSKVPISQSLTEEIIVQDFSVIPPNVVHLWIQDFLFHSAIGNVNVKNWDSLVLNIRTAIAVVADTIPDVTIDNIESVFSLFK